MFHRHLTHQDYTLAAIDDVIARGGLPDWFDLQSAIHLDPSLQDKVLRICAAHPAPSDQRFRFWNHYVRTKGQRAA